MVESQLTLYARTRDPAVRDEIVKEYLGFAHGLSHRYARRGEPVEDLEQVAAMALVKAVDRFDPERGVKFTTFAAPTIIGELKRHFRDKGWAVQVPRRLQELYLELGKTAGRLSQELGRSPTVAELAGVVGASEEDVLEAMELGQTAYQGASLSQPTGDGEGTTIADRLVANDNPVEEASTNASLRSLLNRLPERERTILYLRYFEDMTQSDIADRVGLSQMHVSRLIRQSLTEMRRAARGGDPDSDDE
ncbi:MAG TPA: SigB/SigF/SigG family RNA polymerase sigma factor [Acidimicrobiia bacterium]|nr:SigB/SigF/SigG family RNA polymerase sigma factor [Acidimicrobiia bacterium]